MFKNFAIIVALLFLIKITTFGNNLLFSGVKGEYCFYTQTSVSSNFISVESGKAKEVKSKLKGVCGESLKFKYNKKTLNRFLNKYGAKFKMSESGKEFKTCYYYSEKIANYQLIGGVKVNIQVAYSSDTITIASPIIYGAF